MPALREICGFLDEHAPTRLAEEWDNVGLLAGDPSAKVARIMTCLTVTPESAREAIARRADLIVTHHPLPFHPIKKMTTDSTPTRLLWELIGAGIAIHSPHTGFDSAGSGINQMMGQRMGLQDIKPIVADAALEVGAAATGAGRFGRLNPPIDLESLITNVKRQFAFELVQYVGALDQSVSVVAVACGSGGSFLDRAIKLGCDAFITGEAGFHSCLEAKANDVSIIMLGHYSSERFAVEILASVLQTRFCDLEVWCSEKESDPVKFG